MTEVRGIDLDSLTFVAIEDYYCDSRNFADPEVVPDEWQYYRVHHTLAALGAEYPSLGRIAAFAKIQLIAAFLNEGREFDMRESGESHWGIQWGRKGGFGAVSVGTTCWGLPVFATEALAQKAIELMGEEDLKLLFGINE